MLISEMLVRHSTNVIAFDEINMYTMVNYFDLIKAIIYSEILNQKF